MKRYNGLPNPTRDSIAGPPEAGSSFRLEVNVLFTTAGATQSALNTAQRLAHRLAAKIKLIVPQVVPFPLPLAKPAVEPDFTARKTHEVMALDSFNTEIDVCLCRQALDAALCVLKPNSLVLIGGRKRFWPTRETRLANELRRQGHHVLFVDQQ